MYCCNKSEMTLFTLLLVISTVQFCFGNANQTDFMGKKCTQRYDLKVGLETQSVDPNCTQYGYTQPLICKDELVIWYFDMPPYIMKLKNGKVDGIIPALLDLVVNACCNYCTKIKYTVQITSLEELTLLAQIGNYSMYTPAIAVRSQDVLFGLPYLKLIDTPGVSYIKLDGTSEALMIRLTNSIFNAWPLFAILLLLTLMGGIIVWILDTRSNSDEFPSGFLRGIAEGGWWAFISMTTVGYGDKAPKSYLARIFSVFWITVGLAICSMFTASLSSSLTSALMVEETKLEGKKVGIHVVLSMGYEENIVYREGGDPIAYMNATEMIKDLKSGVINGIIVDKYMLRYNWETYKSAGVNLEIKNDIKNSETGIGAFFSSKELGKWSVFLKAFFDANLDAESRLISDAIKKMDYKLPDEVKGQVAVADPFSSATFVRNVIGNLGIIAAAMFGAVLIFTLLKRLYRAKASTKIDLESIRMKSKGGCDEAALKEMKNVEALAKAMEERLVNCFREYIDDMKKEIELSKERS